jgi:hypothetical protein
MKKFFLVGLLLLVSIVSINAQTTSTREEIAGTIVRTVYGLSVGSIIGALACGISGYAHGEILSPFPAMVAGMIGGYYALKFVPKTDTPTQAFATVFMCSIVPILAAGLTVIGQQNIPFDRLYLLMVNYFTSKSLS